MMTEYGSDRRVTHLVKLDGGNVLEPDYVNVTERGWLNYSYEKDDRVDSDKTWFRVPPHRVQEWQKTIHAEDD